MWVWWLMFAVVLVVLAVVGIRILCGRSEGKELETAMLIVSVAILAASVALKPDGFGILVTAIVVTLINLVPLARDKFMHRQARR